MPCLDHPSSNPLEENQATGVSASTESFLQSIYGIVLPLLPIAHTNEQLPQTQSTMPPNNRQNPKSRIHKVRDDIIYMPQLNNFTVSGASSSFSVRNTRNRPYADSPYGSTGSVNTSSPGSIPPMSRDHTSFSGLPPMSAPASRASGSGSITSSQARSKARGIRWDQSELIASVAAIFVRIRLEPGGGGLFHQHKRVFKGSDLLTSAAEAFALHIGSNENNLHPCTLDDPTLYKVSVCFPYFV